MALALTTNAAGVKRISAELAVEVALGEAVTGATLGWAFGLGVNGFCTGGFATSFWIGTGLGKDETAIGLVGTTGFLTTFTGTTTLGGVTDLVTLRVTSFTQIVTESASISEFTANPCEFETVHAQTREGAKGNIASSKTAPAVAVNRFLDFQFMTVN